MSPGGLRGHGAQDRAGEEGLWWTLSATAPWGLQAGPMATAASACVSPMTRALPPAQSPTPHPWHGGPRPSDPQAKRPPALPPARRGHLRAIMHRANALIWWCNRGSHRLGGFWRSAKLGTKLPRAGPRGRPPAGGLPRGRGRLHWVGRQARLSGCYRDTTPPQGASHGVTALLAKKSQQRRQGWVQSRHTRQRSSASPALQPWP